jgi:hypothetical protein
MMSMAWSLNLAFVIVATWFIGHCLAQDKGPRIILVESSPFQMVLYPTASELNAQAALKLEEKIRESLFASAISSSSATLASVFDIDIILRDLTWINRGALTDKTDSSASSTELKFVALATFLSEDDTPSSALSRFAVDSLVIQTYSRLSSKHTFVEMLQLSNNTFLEDISDAFLEETKDVTIEPSSISNAVAKGGGWSRIEIVLTCSSLLILCGIGFMLCQHHNDPRSQWSSRFQSLNAQSDQGGLIVFSHPGIAISETNKEICGVHEESKEFMNEQPLGPILLISSDFGRNAAPESPLRMSTPSDWQETEDLQSTPRSSKSVPWSFSEVSSKGQDSGSPKTGDAYVTEGDSMSSSTSVSSPLSPRKLCLPDITNQAKNLPSSPSLTSKSGDPYLFSSSAEPRIIVGGDDQTASADSAHSDYKSQSSPMDSSCYSASTMKSDVRLDMAELGANWMNIKSRRDLEEVDGSIGDLFQVDVDASHSRNESEGDSSGFSAVSAWMKSIRVVNSFETFTSTMTNSSTEESAIQESTRRLPEGADCSSLERSLAHSRVEL